MKIFYWRIESYNKRGLDPSLIRNYNLSIKYLNFFAHLAPQ